MIDLIKNLASINRRIKSSTIREVMSLTLQPGMISFAGGNPDPEVFPLKELKEISNRVIEQQGHLAFQYGVTDGLPQLKEQIVKFLREHEGLTIEPKNLLITSSSQQALDLLGKTFIDPADPVLVEDPTYLGALQVFKAYGSHVLGVGCDNDGVVVERLEEKLNLLKGLEEHYKFVYLVPDFQNPSGITLSAKRRPAVVALTHKYNVFLIEDTPYHQVRFEGKSPAMLQKLDHRGNVITLCSFSKIFVPGLRLGYIVAHEDIIRKMTLFKQSLDLCSPSFNQLIAAEFLKQGLLTEHIKKIVTCYRTKRDVMLQALERYMPKHDGISWTRPAGGLFLWLRLPETIDTGEMFNDVVKKNVLYIKGSQFFANGAPHNTMRLNFSFPTQAQIEDGIRRLAGVVKTRLKSA